MKNNYGTVEKLLRMTNRVLLCLTLMVLGVGFSKPWWGYSLSNYSTQWETLRPVILFIGIMYISLATSRIFANHFSKRFHLLLFPILWILIFLVTSDDSLAMWN